ncbi:hypothetical protein [Thalassoglobus sp.]|uniref:hypothetical protein n=1 Tax=Thalassoglobus sp. TaxID=2795869 RepID=UPI003AA9405D
MIDLLHLVCFEQSKESPAPPEVEGLLRHHLQQVENSTYQNDVASNQSASHFSGKSLLHFKGLAIVIAEHYCLTGNL